MLTRLECSRWKPSSLVLGFVSLASLLLVWPTLVSGQSGSDQKSADPSESGQPETEQVQAGQPESEPSQGESSETEPSETEEGPAGLSAEQERSYATLWALQDSLEAKRNELLELRSAFDPSVDSELRLQQLDEIRTLQTEIEKLANDFESIATGIDVQAFEQGVEEELDLVEELTNFLRPILSELREATESPRELERLRKLGESLEEQEARAQQAIASLSAALEDAPIEKLEVALEVSLDKWRARLREIQNARTVAEFQLERLEEERESVYDSTRGALAKFFRTRGLHLGLALAAFIGILLALRGVYKLIRKALPHLSKEDRPFYTRLVDVLYFTLSGLLAVAGALLVLYSTGDWGLLGLALLGLLGLAWASKTALPMFFEQIHLLLNLGTVREAERVVVNGLPFRVSKISLQTELTNPALMGGKLRLPLRDLPNLRSRRSAKEEAWFPTGKGDWVLLSDEHVARVEQQTLEFVRLRKLGGSLLHVPTTDFLSMGAENLSRGFRVEQRFGVDYAHQAISTTEIPARMRERLESGLAALTEDGQVQSVKVEFLEAGASSLDYEILCDFDGSSAKKYNELRRAMQRILVDTCTDEGWVIPFTQITMHEAAQA